MIIAWIAGAVVALFVAYAWGWANGSAEGYEEGEEAVRRWQRLHDGG